MGAADCFGACGACLVAIIALGYLAGSVVCLYYSAKAWHDEGDADSSADGCGSAVDWNKFITIWSGIICYGLFIAAKQATSSKDVLKDAAATAAALWLCGIGFGFGTYDKYYDVCASPDLSQTAHSIEVFMYFWLTIAGSITAGGLCVGIVAALDSCQAAPPPATSGATLRQVIVAHGAANADGKV